MENGKFAFCALLLVAVALPVSTGGANATTNASASARITLYIAPRAEVRPTGDPGIGHLCLAHIPAFRYYLSVRDIGDDHTAENRLPGQSGNYCVPVSASRQGKVVLIVAE